MTKYYIALTQQEELQLKQIVVQPGFEVVFKLLQMESLDAQAAAMECMGEQQSRLMALTDAQATVRVVSRLTQKLASYREIIQQPIEEALEDALGFNMQYERKAN